MKRFIKKISLALSLIMLVLTIPFGVNIFAEEQSVYSLTEGQEGLLRHLGILGESVVNYDKQITRGELAHIAAGVANIKDTAINEQVFYDVNPEHKYYQEIGALSQLGIVAGNGYGYFMPDSIVGDAEICKIFASILGYRETGHYGSYVGVAKSAGITENVEMDNIVTYGEALEMAYNALHCSMVEVHLLNNGGVSYVKNSELLAVEYYHNLVMQKGILEGADYTELTKVNDEIEKGKVMINGRIFTCDSADNLLGQAVVFYSQRANRRTGDTADLIEYINSNSRNTVLSVDPAEIILAETDYDTLAYYENDKKKEVELDVVDVIINGMAAPDFEINDLKPDAGKVTLIDNNFDEKFDVILIEKYHYVLAQSVDAEKGIVRYARDAQGNSGVFGDPNREDVRFTASDNGRKILPSSLTNGAPIVVKISENTEGLLKIEVSPLRVAVEGAVKALSDEEIKVENKKFKFADASALLVKNEVSINDRVQVYTHLDRCVAIIHSSGGNYTHGWMVYAWKTQEAFDEYLTFRIINRDRSMIDYTVKERLVIDNNPYTNSDTILGKLNESAMACTKGADGANRAYSAEYPHWQMVRYKLDSAGEISHIDTVLAGKKLADDELYGVVDETGMEIATSLNGNYVFSSTNRSFYTDASPAELVCTLPSSFTTWTVPLDASVRDNPDYYFPSRTGGPTQDTAAYVGIFSADTEARTANYALYYHNVTEEGTTGTLSGNFPYIVADKCITLGSEGEPVTQIDVINQTGTITTLYLSEYLSEEIAAGRADDVNIGDMIFFQRNPKADKTVAIKHVWKVGDVTSGLINSESNIANKLPALTGYKTLGGTIIDIKDGIVDFTTSMENSGGIEAMENFNRYLANGSTVYFVYDPNDRETLFRIGDSTDLATYANAGIDADEVFIAHQTGTIKFIYIVKK